MLGHYILQKVTNGQMLGTQNPILGQRLFNKVSFYAIIRKGKHKRANEVPIKYIFKMTLSKM